MTACLAPTIAIHAAVMQFALVVTAAPTIVRLIAQLSDAIPFLTTTRQESLWLLLALTLAVAERTLSPIGLFLLVWPHAQ